MSESEGTMTLALDSQQRWQRRCRRRYLILASLWAMAATPLAVMPSLATAMPLALFVGLLALMLAFRHPEWMFWALLVGLPFNDYIGIPLGGVTLRLYMVVGLFGSLWLLWSLSQQTDPLQPSRELSFAGKSFWKVAPLALLIPSKLLTLASLEELPQGMTRLFAARYIVIYALLFSITFLLSAFINSQQRIVWAVRLWLLCSMAALAYAFLQLLLSNAFGYDLVVHREVLPIGRPSAFFREPDVLASYLAASLFVALPWLLEGRRDVFSIGVMATIVASLLVGTVVLFVRASWLGLILASALLLFCYAVTRQKIQFQRYTTALLLLTILSGTLAVTFAPAAVAKVGHRISTLFYPEEESASQYRLVELRGMLRQMFPAGFDGQDLLHLLVGRGDFAWSFWGPSVLGYDYDKSLKEIEQQGRILVHPGFNMPLSIIYDNGLIGLALMGAFFFVCYKTFFSILPHTSDPFDRAALMGFFLAIQVMLVCFFFSYDPITPFFWGLLGIYLGVYHYVRAQAWRR